MSTPDETTTRTLDALAGNLAAWLPAQRWFGGKDRAVSRVRAVAASTLRRGDPALHHALVEVEQDDESTYYQLLLGARSNPAEYLQGSAIGQRENIWYFDATQDAELASQLLAEFTEFASYEDTEGTAAPVFALEPEVVLKTGLRARPITAEQSNTSLVFGQHYVLKLFRKLQPGENRDLRLHRSLHGVGCQHIATPLGSITGELSGEPTTLGMLQEFLPYSVDGWALATASVRDLMAEADLHADEVGGDFAGEAYRLGQAVARVHADLVAALGQDSVGSAGLDAMVDGMHRRLDEVLAVVPVPALAEHEAAVRAIFDAARATEALLHIQTVHGDLHLGQTLRGNTGWVLIDFEGEPATEAELRGQLASPLTDVAGMIRSFDYAAHQHLVGYPADHQHAVRGKEWADRNAGAFCEGYATVGADAREHGALLRACVLHKAVYEVGYEHANRPDWLDIPLGAVARITARAGTLSTQHGATRRAPGRQ
ncbi:MAG: maltokinase N-terminal cap-like domain-containing protein [Sciscionella sp.]